MVRHRRTISAHSDQTLFLFRQFLEVFDDEASQAFVVS